MKILITGSHGMLATDLARVASEAGHEVIGLSHRELDVMESDQVRRALEQFRPDVVVNTPGISVDACEIQPEVGYRIHTWAAGVLARQCQRTGATFVYISTCGLFGDEVRHYSEYDPVVLKTHYARSKYLGELAASQACERTFVIRPGWLYGGNPSHPRNFVYQRYLEARDKPVVMSAKDKFGCPTYTGDLAAKVLEIVGTGEYGTYHVTNEGCASRYEYVKCIVEAFGLETAVEPVDSSAFSRSAPVPDCEVLDNLNLRFVGLVPAGPWQESIHRYVDSLVRSGV